MALNPGTNKQVPEHSILDHFNKQTYLGNRYMFALGAQTIAGTSETPLILIRNAAVTASSFPSGWAGLFLDYRKMVCLTASQTAVLRAYLNPTVTANGTAQTPTNLRIASPNTPIAAVTLSPTVSANGKFIATLSSAAFNPDLSTLLTVVDPGESLLLTIQVSAANAVIASEVSWYEI